MLVTTNSNEETITELTAENCEVSLEQTASHRVELTVREQTSLRRFRLAKQLRGKALTMTVETGAPSHAVKVTSKDKDSDDREIRAASSTDCNVSVTREGDHRYTVVLSNPGDSDEHEQWELAIEVAADLTQPLAMAETPSR